MIYKFRMLMEGNDTFMREYELLVTQSFESFHDLIHATVKFQSLELASFFICDSDWNRVQEITLLDMQEEMPDEERKELPEVIVMKNALLKDFMDEPRQRIIYEYDFLKPKTFYIELSGIGKPEPGIDYPRCVYSRGDIEIAPPAVDDLDDLLGEEEYEDLTLDGLDELLKDLGGEEITIEGPDEE